MMMFAAFQASHTPREAQVQKGLAGGHDFGLLCPEQSRHWLHCGSSLQLPCPSWHPGCCGGGGEGLLSWLPVTWEWGQSFCFSLPHG